MAIVPPPLNWPRVMRITALMALALGIAAALASQVFVRSVPIDGTQGAADFRGWPLWFSLDLSNPTDDVGTQVWFQEKTAPAVMDHEWQIGPWAGGRFFLDAVLFGGTAFIVIMALVGLSRRRRRRPGDHLT
jgi:hypothetical protein